MIVRIRISRITHYWIEWIGKFLDSRESGNDGFDFGQYTILNRYGES